MAAPPRIVLSPRNLDRAAELATALPSVRVAADNDQVLRDSSVVVLCLLPTDAAAVLGPLKFRADHAIVSVMAGHSVSQLEPLVAPATDIARSIPLCAVATRGAVTPIYPATRAAVALYNQLGGCLRVPDELAYEALSATSATIAAHFRHLETIADWLAQHGVPSNEARRYVARTFASLSNELRSPDANFAVLAASHTTTGGLNEQFARDLDNAGVYEAVKHSLDALLARLTQK